MTNHKSRAQTQPNLHPMIPRQTTIHRQSAHPTGAKWKSFAPRIEFLRGAHDRCHVLTPTAATTSGVRTKAAAKTGRPKLKNPRARRHFTPPASYRGAKRDPDDRAPNR